MLGAVFVISGWAAARDPEGRAEQARPFIERLEPKIKALHPSLPTDAKTLVRLNGAAQVAGGLLLATGRAPRQGALLLAGSVLPTTLAGHPYWAVDDPQRRAQERIHFLKNLGLMGGLLLAALDREGRPDLRWRAGHATKRTLKRARRRLRGSSPIPLHHR